jgi:hypothetical protein
VVIRPPFEEIQNLITSNGCFIKKEARKRLVLELKKLDDLHCLFMDRFDFSWKSPIKLREQIRNKTAILPSLVPICERSIIYTLVLQIEMLDLALENRDRKKALFLKEKRKRKKHLSKDKKIYGDYRDVYFFLIIDMLGDISELHRFLGVKSEINFKFPTGILESQVQSYLSAKIRLVTREAEKLLDQK